MKKKQTILVVGISIGLLVGTYFIIKGLKTKKQDSVPPSGKNNNTSNTKVSGGNASTNSNVNKKAIVIDGVNVRVSPSTSSSVKRVATKGETFTILEQSGTWYRISEGWITAKPEFVRTV